MSNRWDEIRQIAIVLSFGVGIVAACAAIFCGAIYLDRLDNRQPINSPEVREFSIPRTEEQREQRTREREAMRQREAAKQGQPD